MGVGSADFTGVRDHRSHCVIEVSGINNKCHAFQSRDQNFGYTKMR